MLTKRWYGCRDMTDIVSVVFADDMQECVMHGYTKADVELALMVCARASVRTPNPFFDVLEKMGEPYHYHIGDTDYWIPYRKYMDEDDTMVPIGEDHWKDTMDAIVKWCGIKEEEK